MADGNAIGMIEVKGLSNGVRAANAAVNAAEVRVTGLGYLHEGMVMVTVRGDVASVRAAIDAAAEEVGHGLVHAASVLARPAPQVEAVVRERMVAVGGRVGAPRVRGRGAGRQAPAGKAAPGQPQRRPTATETPAPDEEA